MFIQVALFGEVVLAVRTFRHDEQDGGGLNEIRWMGEQWDAVDLEK